MPGVERGDLPALFGKESDRVRLVAPGMLEDHPDIIFACDCCLACLFKRAHYHAGRSLLGSTAGNHSPAGKDESDQSNDQGHSYDHF